MRDEADLSSGVIRMKKGPKKGDRLESQKVGLTLPLSSMERIQSYYLASSILLRPVDISFIDFSIMALNCTKHLSFGRVSYDILEKTTFYSLRLPLPLRRKLSSYHNISEKSFGDFVRSRFIACNSINEGYHILAYVWTVKLIMAILENDLSPAERNKLLYEDDFPGPTALYHNLHKLLKGSFYTVPTAFDETILEETSEILNKYHEQRSTLSRGVTRPRATTYGKNWLEDLLGVFTYYLLMFPILLGDLSTQYQSSLGEKELRFWEKSREWGADALSSFTQILMASFSKDGFKATYWNTAILSSIRQSILDILSSITPQEESEPD